MALEQSRLADVDVAPCASGQVTCFNICCPSGDGCSPPIGRDGQPACTTPGCFPATATVLLEGGAQKAIHDVRLGDRVMVARADGSLGYEEVYLNTHKDSVSSAPYVELALASGRSLTLSPRHFIPVAAGPASAWAEQVAKGANEIAVGDIVWSRADDGQMVPDEVAAVRTTVAVGAYNPLTMNGTIVVDGVVASAHSDWFLDGVVSADAQTKVYQAILAPVRVAYRALGPARMETITEGWGVVDFVREATTPSGRSPGSGWIWPGVVVLAALGAAFLWRRRSAGPLRRPAGWHASGARRKAARRTCHHQRRIERHRPRAGPWFGARRLGPDAARAQSRAAGRSQGRADGARRLGRDAVRRCR